MNSFLVTMLCVLPVVGGLIAWLGDVIGYRVGKARRSLFGLRPRTTARLIGVAVGAVLPLIGLGVAAAGSQQVRIALLHLQELRAEAARLRQANQRLIASQRELRAKVQQLEEQVTRAQARVKRAESDAEKAENRLRKLQGRLAAAQARLVRARRRMTEVLHQRDELLKEVAGLKARQQELSQALERAHRRAAEIDSQRREAEEKLQQAQEQLVRAQQQLREVAQEARKLRAQRDGLQAELQDLVRQRNDLAREIGDLKRALQATKEYLEEQQKKLEAAQQRVRDWQEYLAKMRVAFARRLEQQQMIEDSPVVFEVGEEIVRARVSAQQRRDQIEAALSEVLVMANNVALRKGVRPDRYGRAVILIRPLPVAATPGERLSEEEIISAVAERVAEREADEYIVIVRALERHFAREPEPVRVEMWVTPDKIRFRAGEVVERIVFSPGVKRGEVLRRILATRPHLRAVARGRGLLPDPKTGEFGALSAEEIIKAVDEVAKAKGPVELRMIVAEDIRTAEPLKVRLEVVRVRGKKEAEK